MILCLWITVPASATEVELETYSSDSGTTIIAAGGCGEKLAACEGALLCAWVWGEVCHITAGW